MSTTPDALLDGERALEPLHEPVEVQQLRLRIAMRFLGELGDDLFEVPRDVADRGVLLCQLQLQLGKFFSEAGRQRLDRIVLRFLEQLPLRRHDLVDRRLDERLPARIEIQA
jgi:hypothetical protein